MSYYSKKESSNKGSLNHPISLKNTNSVPVTHRIRIYDRASYDFIGQHEVMPIDIQVLQKIFDVSPDNPMLLSYRITQKQVALIERLTGLNLDLEKYQYFMDYDI
ncbi:DUF7683 domain-containing protein [Aliikangiella coralliicola]|uniref:DUF7683 domain-containing protein n=1 Tax=Aliikangiella coralliicola TaxID=2592383 RepID=A0A545TV08_9GAMM|nr:hypothetical protein [Aliikangiella coralliicola]TQV81046.1 hypothetical protein FLL46_25885 [Aliikangiella coralliicola]